MNGLMPQRERWPRVRDLTGWTFAVLSTISVALAIAVALLVHGLHPSRRINWNLATTQCRPDRVIPRLRRQSGAKRLTGSVARLSRLSGVRWAENQVEFDRCRPFDAWAGNQVGGRPRRRSVLMSVPRWSWKVLPTSASLARFRSRHLYGKITARVGKNAHGFSIVTPQGKVVDLGTNFGLRIDRSGREEIAVFEGQVDIDYSPGRSDLPRLREYRGRLRESPPPSQVKRRLTAGEAVCVSSRGELARLPAITSETFPHSVLAEPEFPPVIAAVADDIRLPESASFTRSSMAGWRMAPRPTSIGLAGGGASLRTACPTGFAGPIM